MHVARHPFDAHILEQNVKLNDNSIGVYLKELDRQNYLVVRGLERLSLENLSYSASLAYPVEQQLHYLDMFIDASLAKYQMATHVGERILIDFSGKRHELTPGDNDYSVNEQNWMCGYMAALARRKMATVHAFCAVDMDVVAKRKQTKGGVYVSLFVKFLQRLFMKGEPHGQSLLAVASGIKKGAMPDSVYEYALCIDGPVVDMFVPVFMNDGVDFNAMMRSALELHERYWKKAQANLPAGLISLPITALAVMAKDYELSVEHTSDYVLQYLVDG